MLHFMGGSKHLAPEALCEAWPDPVGFGVQGLGVYCCKRGLGFRGLGDYVLGFRV